jgi:hypothetical protein
MASTALVDGKTNGPLGIRSSGLKLGEKNPSEEQFGEGRPQGFLGAAAALRRRVVDFRADLWRRLKTLYFRKILSIAFPFASSSINLSR